MKTVKDIVKSVDRKLKEGFPRIPVMSLDRDKNVKTPCFFVEYEFNRDGSMDFFHDYGEVTIYYFPENEHENRMELLDIQEKLSELFYSVLNIDTGFAIPINELEFDITNNKLSLSFELEMWQMVEEEGEPMEELEME